MLREGAVSLRNLPLYLGLFATEHLKQGEASGFPWMKKQGEGIAIFPRTNIWAEWIHTATTLLQSKFTDDN
jgi:hypothetical protein